MNKSTQTLLTELRKQQVSVATVVTYLSLDDNVSRYGLDSFMNLLSEYREPILSSELVNHLIDIIVKTIEEERVKREAAINELIVNHSFIHYHEIFTTKSDFTGESSVITEYLGKQSGDNLNYSVFHPSLERCTFTLGNLVFVVEPADEISFTQKDGSSKAVSYKYTVKITHTTNPVAVVNDFKFFKKEALYFILGMAYLKDPENVTTNITDDRIVLTLDTFPFHLELAKKYNAYYSNLLTTTGIKFSDLEGIEKCQVDQNGLILVPKLFTMSSLILDGDIAERPFVWDNDQGFEPIDLRQNQYRISINFPKAITDAEATAAVNILLRELSYQGIMLHMGSISKNNAVNNSINCTIADYETYGNDVQSMISKHLTAERKLSEAFKSLCRRSRIGIPNSDFHVKGNTVSTDGEKYSFAYESGDIRPTYVKGENKFMVYFNRSAYMISGTQSNDSSDLTKLIEQTNTAKFNYNPGMIERYSREQLVFRGKRYDNAYSNYIPISFVPVGFSKTEGRGDSKKTANYTGISFIPFGFAKYSSTDINQSLSSTGYAVYGSQFAFSPAKVTRVLKLSNDVSEISNIVQVVIRSNVEPIFNKDRSQPLKIQKINDDHYLALFRASDFAFEIVTPSTWFFANDYTQDDVDRGTSALDTMTLNLTLTESDQLFVTKSSLLRFYIETIAMENDFKTSIFGSHDRFFTSEDSISLQRLFSEFYASGSVNVDGISPYFFKLLSQACETGVPNDSVLDLIYTMTLGNMKYTASGEEIQVNKVKFDSVFNMVKLFIKSIQNPITSISLPFFNESMQLRIRNKYLAEITDVSNTIYSYTSALDGKDSAEMNAVATKEKGLLRRVISMISDLFSELPGETSDSKISSSTLATLRTQVLNELTRDADTLIFPNAIGTEITPRLIQKAAEELTPEKFSKFISEVYSMITTDNYEELIRSLLDDVLVDVESIAITQLSIYSYNLTLNKSLEDAVRNLHGRFLGGIIRTVSVTNSEREPMKFGEYTYDPNIHCMFTVTHPMSVELEDIIMETLHNGHIFYTRVGDCRNVTDLSIVSIYHTQDEFEHGAVRTTRFFLPFLYNNGKLSVTSTRWNIGDVVYSLDCEVCEIAVVFNKVGDVDELRKISRKIFCETVLDVDSSDLGFINSVCLGVEPIQKPYTIENQFYHYIFTEHIKSSLSSNNVFKVDDLGFPEEMLNELKSSEIDEISIMITPTPSIIPKTYIRTNKIASLEGFKYFGKQYGKLYSLSVKACKEYLDRFVENSDVLFIERYRKSESSSDEVMIINNKYGVYTKYYGNKVLESTIATGENQYSTYLTEVNFEVTDELSNIDRIMLTEKIDLENAKRMSGNIIHNLSIAMSNIRWEAVAVDNYKFYVDEKPKWVKFSKDSYFMGVGFKSGVKIYIKAGTKYVFCNNLNHESVHDIFFGNKQFCITTQYDDTSREFAIMWITSAGIPVNLKLPFYTPVEGDAVNIKYISGTTSKEKKNVILELDSDGHMKYGAFKVQYAEPIFNHNVYFFSPDDKYLIYNKRGTFLVYDLQEAEHISFATYNGSIIDKTAMVSKCLEKGEWISPSVFVGFTYLFTRPLEKVQVTLDLSKKSIVSVSATPEYPDSTRYERMKIDGSVKTHPLYSYLMNYKTTNVDPNVVGCWIHDCFISLVKEDDKWFFEVRSIHGTYDRYPTGLDGERTFAENSEFLETSVHIFQFFVDENYVIYAISWVDRIIYDRTNASSFDHSNTPLQYIERNFFTFTGSSICLWEYKDNATEITHITLDGYEKIIFEGRLIVFTLNNVKVGVITNGYLALKDINVSSEINSETQAVDVSKIVKPVDQVFMKEIIAYTETSVENYSSSTDTLIPINVDSKPISGHLCLNRSDNYTLKSHADASNTNMSTHGNLLVSVNGREVKIIPKIVQIPKRMDGFNMGWYLAHEDGDWDEKERALEKYISDTSNFINIGSKDVPFDMDRLVEVFRDRTDVNVMEGFEIIKGEVSDEIYNCLLTLYHVFSSVRAIYSKVFVTEAIREYEKQTPTATNKILLWLRNIHESKRSDAYDEFLKKISPLYGNIFSSSLVLDAFKLIRELQYNVVNRVKVSRTPEAIIDVVTKQPNTDERQMKITEIVKHVLSVPVRGFKVSQISSIDLFKNRLMNIREEISKIRLMKSGVSRYDLYKAKELTEVKDLFNKYSLRVIAMRRSMSVLNQTPDYVIGFEYNIEDISELPEGLLVTEDGTMMDDTYVYYEVTNGFKRIRHELANVVELNAVMDTLMEPIRAYLIAKFSSNKIKGAKVLELINLSTLCGMRKIPEYETEMIRDMKDFKSYLVTNSMGSNFRTVETAITEFGYYCEMLIKCGKTSLSIDELMETFVKINDIRFPFPTNEYGDYTGRDTIRSVYNVEFPDDSDINFLDWNLVYVDKTFTYLFECLSRGYHVTDGTYNEEYRALERKLKPLLHKYRNGVSEDRQVPVTVIKLIFPEDVKFVKASEYGQNELNDMTFEYSIPESDRMYGIETGLVKVNLFDIIMRFDDRDAVNEDRIVFTIDSVFDMMAMHDRRSDKGDGLRIIKKVLPPIDNISVINNLSSLRDAFNSRYRYTTLRGRQPMQVDHSVETFKRNYSSYPQITTYPIDIDYKGDYITAGFDIFGVDYPMIYKNKKSGYTSSSISEVENIALGMVKPIDFDPKVIRKNGTISLFERNNTEYVVYYGNTMRDGHTMGFVVLQDVMTRETTVYNYIKVVKKEEIMSYIIDLKENDDGSITIQEKVLDSKFERGHGMIPVVIEATNTYSSLSGLLADMKQADGLTKKKYEDIICDDVSVKVCGNLHAIVTRYKCGAHYGTVADIYEAKDNVITKVNSWNFHMFDVKAFDLTSKSLFVLGTVNGLGSSYYAKMGVMNIKETTQSKPIFVKTFDREIKIASSKVEMLSNCSIIAGKTTYVTFRSKYLSHLIVINNKRHYETRNINEITSVSVSRECGFISLYYKSLGHSEIWTCNGQLYEIVDGECNWM